MNKPNRTKRVVKERRPRFEDYERVTVPGVTFGTSVYIRGDGLALKIVFPAGQIMTFAPEEIKVFLPNSKKV